MIGNIVQIGIAESGILFFSWRKNSSNNPTKSFIVYPSTYNVFVIVQEWIQLVVGFLLSLENSSLHSKFSVLKKVFYQGVTDVVATAIRVRDILNGMN